MDAKYEKVLDLDFTSMKKEEIIEKLALLPLADGFYAEMYDGHPLVYAGADSRSCGQIAYRVSDDLGRKTRNATIARDIAGALRSGARVVVGGRKPADKTVKGWSAGEQLLDAEVAKAAGLAQRGRRNDRRAETISAGKVKAGRTVQDPAENETNAQAIERTLQDKERAMAAVRASKAEAEELRELGMEEEATAVVESAKAALAKAVAAYKEACNA